MDELTEKELKNIVLCSATEFGFESDLWTVGRLHSIITEKFQVNISKQTVWRRLVEAGLTYQKPEREYCGSLVFRLYDKRIASTEVIEFLEQMLRHHPRRHLVVVMDRATPHTSKLTQSFIASQKRLRHFYLPSYSPHWNPDEKVWNYLKCQELKSHQAKTKEELKALTQTKLDAMSKNPELLRGIYFRCRVADFLQ